MSIFRKKKPKKKELNLEGPLRITTAAGERGTYALRRSPDGPIPKIPVKRNKMEEKHLPPRDESGRFVSKKKTVKKPSVKKK